MLAHFNNVIFPSAEGMDEPLYSNLFEVTFSFPDTLELSDEDAQIMMLNTTNITLPLTPKLTTVTQSFKYSGRVYLKTPTPEDTTLQDINLNFNINVDDRFSMKTWNYMKKWYDLAWNSQTGELHYKREMAGQIVAHIHDRQGVVIRRVEFRNAQITGVGQHEFSWGENGIISGSATFVADHWIDSYFDITND
jgi:hypothetical protein